MNFSEMTDSESANVMGNYIGRVERFRHIIGGDLQGNDCIFSITDKR